MSSVLSVELPENIDSTFLQITIARIRKEKPYSVLLDWSKCRRIDNLSLCLLINLRDECAATKVKIYNVPFDAGSFFITNVHPILAFPANRIDIQEFGQKAFVSSIRDLSKADARSEIMKKYLANHPSLKELETTQVVIVFSELYMNVCQHSSEELFGNGVAMVEIDPATYTLQLIVTDLGFGIPANIKENFIEYADRKDSEAIAYATEAFVTTKSTNQNYGAGLDTLKKSIRAINGHAEIISGKGMYVIDPIGDKPYELDCYHWGTQISITVDFRNFEKREATEFTEEVDF